MDAAHVAHSSPIQLGRRLLALLSLERIAVLFDVHQLFRPWLNHLRREGLYKILDYDSTLELVDATGNLAVFKRRQHVKFLQDYINTFPDYAWEDGQIFADYQCSPGQVVDHYQEGDRWNILISLRETKNRGDIADFYIERTVKNGFTKAEESCEIEIRRGEFRLQQVWWVRLPPEPSCRSSKWPTFDRNQRSWSKL